VTGSSKSANWFSLSEIKFSAQGFQIVANLKPTFLPLPIP
jgi:hypothetical protein